MQGGQHLSCCAQGQKEVGRLLCLHPWLHTAAGSAQHLPSQTLLGTLQPRPDWVLFGVF